MKHKKSLKPGNKHEIGVRVAAALFIVTLLVLAIVAAAKYSMTGKLELNLGNSDSTASNPISGRIFYVDDSRNITKLVSQYQLEGNEVNAKLAQKIASQPGTTWLLGPSQNDPQATRDIREVVRTSKEAATDRTVPIYELYAIPNRDACAGYSKNGFASKDEYLKWIDSIVDSLSTDAVFSIEADAIGHTIGDSCLSKEQIESRYETLRLTVQKLESSRFTLGTYIDAGHPEWFPDAKVLVEPLIKSGVDIASGIAVNVSFSAETNDTIKWSEPLIKELGRQKGVIIDTSRNGKGAPSKNVTGEARWCNAVGRGLGIPPTTNTQSSHVHAYFWGKIAGESDGSCFGSPAAGTFVPEFALDLARNSIE